ncbi:MAG: hypothetical protein KF841_01910 [Phycisphaerae bacterium]|nr:hypothetical protein [Phycisphaerae bacterium]
MKPTRPIEAEDSARPAGRRSSRRHRDSRTLRTCGWLLIVAAVPLVPPIAGILAEDTGPTTQPMTTTRPAASTTQPAVATPTPGDAVDSGRVDELDLIFLANSARSAFRAKAAGAPDQRARFHPETLKGKKGIIHLVLRSDGAVKAEAETTSMDIVDAAISAGTLLATAAIEKGAALTDKGDDFGIELEWLEAPETLTVPSYDQGGVWTESLLHSFEPAVEGIGVEFRGKRALTRPSQVVTLGYTPDLALAACENAIGLKNIHKIRFEREIRYFRFRCHHVWQANSAARPVELRRGDRLIPASAVTRENLDAAIARVGQYLLYRQNSNGEFSHAYIPFNGTYTLGNAARVQLRALDGLAAYAVREKDADVTARLSRGIAAFTPYLEPVVIAESRQDGSVEQKQVGVVLAPPGHSGVLEITARLLLAMKLSRNAGDYDEDCARFVNAILAAQTEAGYFAIAVNNEAEVSADAAQVLNDADSCTALAALAGINAMSEDVRITKSIESAVRYYSDRFQARFEPTAAAALLQALCLHYARSNDARISDMAFDLADRLAALQLTDRNCPYEELHGAINVRRAGEVGADTSIYLASLADALELAERVGDSARIEGYRSAVSAAARFVMQLEFRDDGAFYVRSRRDVLGGIRAALWDGRLRIDHTGLGLLGLIRARDVLNQTAGR